MLLNRKGSEESISWPVAAIIVVVFLFIMYFVFFTGTGIWGKTKTGAEKFFDTAEGGIKLYKEYFGDNEVSINKETEDIKTLILTNFSVKGDNCLGLLDITDQEKIEGFSVYFVRNIEKEGTDFYIFEGNNWMDDFNNAISENKYIKYGFFDGYVSFGDNGKEINEFLLHNHLEYISFVYNGKQTKKITGFMETIDIKGIGKAQLYDKITPNELKTSNFKILNPVFYKNGDSIRFLDIVQLLELYKSKSPCVGISDIIRLVVRTR